jgi:hypothetical protein
VLPLPSAATDEEADMLVQAYRSDLLLNLSATAPPPPPPSFSFYGIASSLQHAPGFAHAAAAAAMHAPASALSAATALAPFAPEVEGTEWDARLPLADPRLSPSARLAVQVRLLRARGLPPKDDSAETRAALRERRTPPSGPSGLASAYCVISIDDLHKRHRARSRTAHHTCEPAWDEAFTFEGVSDDAIVVVDVLDHDPLGFDDVLGKVSFPVAQLRRDGRSSARADKLIEGTLELAVSVWP